jgi:hypothetical protein
MRQFKWHEGISLSGQFVYILGFILVLSILIESTQYFFNRTADLDDIRRNFIGGILAFTFLISRDHSKFTRIKFLRVVVLIVIVFDLFYVVKAVSDEIIAKYQFPVLSNFETPFELDRWHGKSEFIISAENQSEGKKSLKVNLNTSGYSGVWLRYFPKDWSDYNYLNFNIYNDCKDELQIYCRIQDDDYEYRGDSFPGRFTGELSISPGWNDISLSLHEIKNAPVNRHMNMSKIFVLRLFVKKIDSPSVVYIDDVKLSSQSLSKR